MMKQAQDRFPRGAQSLCFNLGTGGHTKTDETLEKFQTAFDPPPHFRKIILRILRQNCDKSAYAYYGRTVIT